MGKSKEFFLIKEILLNSLNKDLRNSVIIDLLEKNIDTIFGEKLKNYLKIEKILNNKIYIICKHQGLVQSFYFNKENILNKIREIFNNNIKINDIIFYFRSINKKSL